jgi:hypothetical protein
MDTIPFTRAHARQAAEIHVEGQPGTFLTRLGIDFLTRMYQAIADSPHAFGVTVVDEDAVAGVAIVALNTTQVFQEMKRQHWRHLLWPMIRQVLRDPLLVGDIVQSIRYPTTLHAPPGEAEVLFLGLRRPYMRRGMAPRLSNLIMDEAHRRGCTSATTLVARQNRTVRWIIAAIPGAYIDREVELNGKIMLVYRVKLPILDESDGSSVSDSQISVERRQSEVSHQQSEVRDRG